MRSARDPVTDLAHILQPYGGPPEAFTRKFWSSPEIDPIELRQQQIYLGQRAAGELDKDAVRILLDTRVLQNANSAARDAIAPRAMALRQRQLTTGQLDPSADYVRGVHEGIDHGRLAAVNHEVTGYADFVRRMVSHLAPDSLLGCYHCLTAQNEMRQEGRDPNPAAPVLNESATPRSFSPRNWPSSPYAILIVSIREEAARRDLLRPARQSPSIRAFAAMADDSPLSPVSGDYPRISAFRSAYRAGTSRADRPSRLLGNRCSRLPPKKGPAR